MSFSILSIEKYKLSRHPMTWALLTLSVGLLSLLFYRLCVDYLQLMQQTLLERNVNTGLFIGVIRPFCSWALVIFMMIFPLFTTMTLSYEYRHKTFYLWATSTWSAAQIVMGKFLSIFLLLILILSFMILMIASLNLATSLEWKAIVLALASIGLIGAAMISFGLFISSIIPYPILAVGLTFMGNTSWLLLEWLNPFPKQWKNLAGDFSLLNHAHYSLNGFLYSADILFYLLFTTFWLIITQRVITYKMTQVAL